MPSVACPTCGEKGRIPHEFIGIRIKCKKCGNPFLVTPPVSKNSGAKAEGSESPADSQQGQFGMEGIELSVMDTNGWHNAEPMAGPERQAEAAPEHPNGQENAPAAVAPAAPSAAASARQYKVLTQRDKWFEGKFDLGRLEEALNHYAREGWVVRSMSTPHITAYTGELREEIVVLLER
jgi:hypothetical protein